MATKHGLGLTVPSYRWCLPLLVVVRCYLISKLLRHWRIIRCSSGLLSMWFVLNSPFPAYLTVISFWSMCEIVRESTVSALHL